MGKIACIQMTSGNDVSNNLKTAQRLIAQAADAGANIAVLPEAFAFIGITMSEQKTHAEKSGHGPIQDFLANLAIRYNLWIIGGTLPLKADCEDQRIRAACLIYDSQGQLVDRYDKIHLFDVSLPNSQEEYCESSVIEAGSKIVVIDTPVGRIGIAVCYDLRFPELFRQQLNQGMDIIAIPSAFTEETGRAHWHPLLTARAIENLCYVAAANQHGEHPNRRKTYGHSLIVDPWGETVNECVENNGIAIADINLKQLHQLRKTFPAIANRTFK